MIPTAITKQAWGLQPEMSEREWTHNTLTQYTGITACSQRLQESPVAERQLTHLAENVEDTASPSQSQATQGLIWQDSRALTVGLDAAALLL